MNRLFAASNPFATRFVRPGALEFRFAAPCDQLAAPSDTAFSDRAVDAPSDRNRHDARLKSLVTSLDQHRIGLLVGNHGSGKSTLLHTLGPYLQHRFPEVHEAQFCDEFEKNLVKRLLVRRQRGQHLQNIVKELPRGGLLTLDGAEQLSRVDFRRLCRQIHRRGLAMLATSHIPLFDLPILHHTVVTTELVHNLTTELVTHAPDAIQQCVHQWLSERPMNTTVNVRDLFFELYDVVHETTCQTTMLGNST